MRTTEYFAKGQSESEDAKDYRTLLKSLRGCARGNCSDCIFCDFSVHNENGSCDQNLLLIAVEQFSKLYEKQYGRGV